MMSRGWMHRHLISTAGFLFFVLAIQMPTFAQSSPKTRASILDNAKLKQWKFTKAGVGSLARLESEGANVFQVTSQIASQYTYQLATKLPVKPGAYKKGEKLLLKFTAKSLSSSFETGEAKVLWQLKTGTDSRLWEDAVISIASQWQTYYLPFEIPLNSKDDELSVVMQFGFPPQQFLIKELSLDLYAKETSLQDLPKTQITYPGMEAEASWRKEAFARIDSMRKGDFEIQFYKDGQPLENVALQVEITDHQFNWGATVRAKDIVERPGDVQLLRENFNTAVLENDLKIKFWTKQTMPTTLKAMDLLKAKGLRLKGHVLIWPGFNHLPSQIIKHENNPEKVIEILNQHIRQILNETKGRIDQWDVVNEAYTNKDLQRITGSEEVLYNAFRFMKSQYPDVKRLVNEYGIISQGGLNQTKREWYYNYIKRIDENTDGAIDGIGIQSHIGTDLTPPVKVLEILDYYAQLGKSISISEFTLDVRDENIRRMYTEDFLIAAFSHPSVTDFIFWGFNNDASGRTDLFDRNGHAGSMGMAYQALVHGLWKTKAAGNTNADGVWKGTGFYGSYNYTYTINGQERKGKFKLAPGEDTVIRINL